MLEDLRRDYHTSILQYILGQRQKDEVRYYTNADGNNNTSRRIADELARRLMDATGTQACEAPPNGQTAGARFGEYTLAFLQQSFQLITHLRPGDWIFTADQDAMGIGKYEQYRHLAELKEMLKQHPELETSIARDYLITPDIVVARQPVLDSEINRDQRVLTEDTPIAERTPFRQAVNRTPILHASISCKWTIRSDRTQNTRTEALNLIRNRKGPTPCIAAVTFEPLPSRIAAIALGTGDIDCTYHGALPELLAAVEAAGFEDALDTVRILVQGRRLRDISDLPFDLAT